MFIVHVQFKFALSKKCIGYPKPEMTSRKHSKTGDCLMSLYIYNLFL